MDERTEEMGELLRDIDCLDLSKAEAYILAYLTGEGKEKAIDIEQAVGLSQPRASTALSFLRGEGYIEKDKEERDGRGANPHLHYISDRCMQLIYEKIQSKVDRLEDSHARIYEYIEGESG